MDSFTQVLLGAAVAESVAGKQLGRKASAWGAVLGILPDLDYFVRYANPVDSFILHRSFSHSLLMFAILTPFLLWVVAKLHPEDQPYRRRWLWLIVLCLATHSLLDCMTIYGTQIFWPVSSHPFGLGSVFIIDPVYTLALLIACVTAVVSRSGAANKVVRAGLLLSTLYLAWGMLAQNIVSRDLERHVSTMDMQVKQVLVTPAPFNSLLWRFVLRVEGGYHEGFISLLDDSGSPSMRFYPSEDEWIGPLQKVPDAVRLMRFSKGLYSVHQKSGELVLSDIRMGVAPDYVFTFKVAELTDGKLIEVLPVRYNNRNFSWSKVDWLIQRIGDASLPLPVGRF